MEVAKKQHIKDILHNGKTIVIFNKTNGEKRKMLCTLNADLIPEQPIVDTEQSKKTRKENPDVQSVWDLEKSAWRSFRFDSVISVDESVEQ